ncbi:MAG: tetratricopeptide repeat protein [Nitrospirota bacterium]
MNIDEQLRSAFQYFQEGNLDQAESVCRDILVHEPDYSDVLHLLGIILCQKRNYESAVEYMGKSLKSDPDNASAYYNLGTAFRELGQIEEAVESFKKSIALDPSSADAFNNLGIALKDKGQFDEALSYYQKAIELNPRLTPAYYNLGVLLQEKGQLDGAASSYRRAAELDNRNAAVHNSLGLVLREKGLLDEAISHYREAVEYEPDSAAFRNNLGIALKERGRPDEALVHFEKSFSVDPNDTALNQIFDIAELFLQKGDLKRGWALYWRFNDSYWHEHIPGKPIWNGADVRGRTILLQSDAGFGDVIQYVRYAALIAGRGAKVILNCPKEIMSLLQTVAGLHKVVTDILPSEFDLFSPVRRLPFVFGTILETVPATIPYIKAELLLVQKWKEKLGGDNAKLRVGLVWAAGHRDLNRSCPLELFGPLADQRDVTFYSLQVGADAAEARHPPGGMKLVDRADEIENFSDTAAIIENLDLTISVDTAAAHVAGALGKPVWTLLPYVVDSRWLLDREDSPWYPTMRLFRQPSPGDWASVIRRLAENLRRILKY